MLAKRFFYVSAALFLLALTYHLGARSATAQAGAQLSVGGLVFTNTGTFSAGVADRTVYYTATYPITSVSQIPAPLPGSSPAVAVTRWGTGDQLVVLLANGDLYDWELGGWYHLGNLLGATTATTPSTWGKVKADYRK